MGARPCHATVIRNSPGPGFSTQPRPPSIAPTLVPPKVSPAPCSAVHHWARSAPPRVAPVKIGQLLVPVPYGRVGAGYIVDGIVPIVGDAAGHVL